MSKAPGLTGILVMIILIASCKKEIEKPVYYAKRVDVVIQNYSVQEPIAVRLTNGCWRTIGLNNSVRFENVELNEYCQLIAFSEFQCKSSFDRIRKIETTPGSWGTCISDNSAKPCVDSLLAFAFSTMRQVDHENDAVTILILAEEVGGRPFETEDIMGGRARFRFTVVY